MKLWIRFLLLYNIARQILQQIVIFQWSMKNTEHFCLFENNNKDLLLTGLIIIGNLDSEKRLKMLQSTGFQSII